MNSSHKHKDASDHGIKMETHLFGILFNQNPQIIR